jgi:hypothetical protein
MDGSAKDIGEMLDTVSAKIPALLNGVIGTLYSAEAGSNMGKAVGSFYHELLEAGIPADEAIKMAKDYMLSLKDVSGMMNNK